MIDTILFLALAVLWTTTIRLRMKDASARSARVEAAARQALLKELSANHGPTAHPDRQNRLHGY